MKYTTITYIGKAEGYTVKMGAKSYEFEWQKGLGIGNKKEDVNPLHVQKIAKWRDKRGKKIFFLE
jgi:hypothetical protein